MAVFFATMEPGDVYMGMNLAHGGHLSHGMAINISGKYFKPVPMGSARRMAASITMFCVKQLWSADPSSSSREPVRTQG